MNSLITILKATSINDYGLNGFSKKIDSTKEKKRILITSAIMLLGISSIAYMITLYVLLMADVLEQIGFLELILVMGILGSTLAVFFTSIYKAQGSLFSSRDYDLLMSLPIKNSTILISKLINLLSLNWIFSAFILIPTSIIYFIRAGNLSWLYFFMVIIGVILVPLIPVILASIIAIIISYFASKFKYKNIITILGSIILLIGLTIGSFYMQDIIDIIAVNSSSLMDMIGKLYPPAVYLTNALIDINFIELLKFVVMSLVPFAAFILLFSKSFKQINSRLGESYKRADYKMKSLKANSLLAALVNKEIKRYISIPIYVLNTFIGMIMILVASISTLFMDGETLAMYLDLPYVQALFPLVILAMMVFCIGLSSTTSSSISLEGKNLWIIKSLPIRTKDIFLGKIILSLIITLPITILVNIIFFVGLKFSIYSLLWNTAISSIYCFVAASGGLLINLYFPKMEWTSVTSVVKQSASVMISLIVTMIAMAIPVGAFILFKISNINMFLGIILLLLVLTLIVLWSMLNRKGIEKFNEL